MQYLTILPPFSARRAADGGIYLTQKFMSGVAAYQQSWTDGPVRVLIEAAREGTDAVGNLDECCVRPAELPWELELVNYEKEAFRPWLMESAVVLLAVQHRQLAVGRWCREFDVPAVFTAENSLRTRLQMLRVEKCNPIVRARRALWLWQEERRIRSAIRGAAGVQCNGTPTFDAYRDLSPDPLLYFDSRVGESMLATEQGVTRRLERPRQTGILHLAFSGRLVAIKGVDHLLAVAEELRRLRVRFHFAICGAGPLEPAMRAQAARLNLEPFVTFKGALDFQRELLPFIREHIDLFVCCHRQGDPSCTYLETMSCGVPIAGYDNEAFHGVVGRSGAGWLCARDRPRQLAARIAALAGDPEELGAHSLRALAFARRHTFERTFALRTAQLRRLAAAPRDSAVALRAAP